jgi:hypothetical protein
VTWAESYQQQIVDIRLEFSAELPFGLRELQMKAWKDIASNVMWHN